MKQKTQSVFESIKGDACKLIQSSESFYQLEEHLKLILEEWDLSEENQYYK